MAEGSNAHLKTKRHSVYRVYDEHDRLLYVGSTSKGLYRLGQQSGAEWWQFAMYVTLEHFPDKASAAHIEQTAIKHEQPIYNVWKPGYDPRRAESIQRHVSARIKAYEAERQAS